MKKDLDLKPYKKIYNRILYENSLLDNEDNYDLISNNELDLCTIKKLLETYQAKKYNGNFDILSNLEINKNLYHEFLPFQEIIQYIINNLNFIELTKSQLISPHISISTANSLVQDFFQNKEIYTDLYKHRKTI